MRNKKINLLKKYRAILIECKRYMLYQKLSNEVENRIPTMHKSKQKVKSLYR